MVSEELRDPMILSIPWNDEQDVICNHPLLCIYVGKNKRVTIYLIDQAPASPTLEFDVSKAAAGKTASHVSFGSSLEIPGAWTLSTS